MKSQSPQCRAVWHYKIGKAVRQKVERERLGRYQREIASILIFLKSALCPKQRKNILFLLLPTPGSSFHKYLLSISCYNCHCYYYQLPFIEHLLCFQFYAYTGVTRSDKTLQSHMRDRRGSQQLYNLVNASKSDKLGPYFRTQTSHFHHQFYNPQQ